MSNTWRDIIRSALLELGVIDPGQGLDDADQVDDALLILKGMLSEWAIDTHLIPTLESFEYTFPSDAKEISIGAEDQNADVTSSSPIETILTLEYRHDGDEEWRILKQTSHSVIRTYSSEYGQYPTMYFYNQAHPVQKIYFDRTAIAGDNIKIDYKRGFSSINVDAPFTDILPVQYAEALRLNLAVKLSSQYAAADGTRFAHTLMQAKYSLNMLRNRNVESLEIPLDRALQNMGSGYRGRNIRVRL